MFTEIFVVLGVIFLLSLLGYIIPQLIVRYSRPLDLKTRYGGGWAFITGGNSGIGESFAKNVAALGFNVVILARDQERLERVEFELKEINSQIKVKTIKADLYGDPVQVTEEIVKQLDGLDISILYFNAGYAAHEDASNPSDKYLKQIHCNIITHQYIFQQLYPRLANRQLNDSQKRRGAVLFTSSGLAIIPNPGESVYGATKAYMGHFGECLATEADAFGIDVVSVYPGVVKTRFTRDRTKELPKFLKKISINPDRVAHDAISGLGRVTRVDTGYMAITMRLITKVFDSYITIKFIQKITSGKKKENQTQ
ncbi:MAG: putative 17 beta-hydroxysteroid dehydrogenase type 3 [Streblomastix strix]|uniref:Putative 17 beta-hydroxysteroid dehydrogenase type 3 n=1 Tax=Streblomastix strix TaxID=222440 RepID=A0A5J4W2I5_9EUKA|nr:MAG: putative 17 beta-hydroxysteroid dehydrogenase type 3 [Streblomastix strix]